MRKYIACFVLFAITACSTPQQRGLTLPAEGPARYFSYGNGYNEDLNSLYQHAPAAGLALHINLDGKFGSDIDGASSIGQLRYTFEDRPGVLPVFILFLDPYVLSDLCGERYDSIIKKLVDELHALDRPAALSLGWQVDNLTWEIDPAVFVPGFKCLADKIVGGAAGAKQVALGLHFGGLSPSHKDHQLTAYYPGRNYVNWIGTSAGKFQPNHFRRDDPFTGTQLPEVFAFAAEENLPVIITEAEPYAVQARGLGSGDTLYRNYYQPLLELAGSYDHLLGLAYNPGPRPDSSAHARFMRAITSGALTTEPLALPTN